MTPAKHVVALKQANEAVSIGERSILDRFVFAWLAVSGAIAGCAISFAVATSHEPPPGETASTIKKALVSSLPRLVK